jgi:hypothetical protein
MWILIGSMSYVFMKVLEENSYFMILKFMECIIQNSYFWILKNYGEIIFCKILFLGFGNYGKLYWKTWKYVVKKVVLENGCEIF